MQSILRATWLKLIFCAVCCTTLLYPGAMAWAQEREFPASAKRGVMRPGLHPHILIDGKPRFLAVNAQIRDEENRLQVPDMLEDGEYLINYQELEGGDVFRIWILTADEARRPAANAADNRNYNKQH